MQACTWTCAWAASSSPSPSSSAISSRPSTSPCPASPPCRSTRTSTATRPRVRTRFPTPPRHDKPNPPPATLITPHHTTPHHIPYHHLTFSPRAGTSVVLYRHQELRSRQFFCFPHWAGGLYITPTIAGSRPGALSAACWAALVAIGEAGYRERVKGILETVKLVAQGVQAIPGLVLQGQVSTGTGMEDKTSRWLTGQNTWETMENRRRP